MSQHDKKRHQDHSQAFEPAHKRYKSWTDGADDQQLKSANDRFAGSIYKGRTLINKTPQKIVFDDAPAIDKHFDENTTNTLSRKKSVTFTPETKHEDGATGQNFSKLWLTPAASARAATDATTTDIAASPTPTKSKPRADTRGKKAKKSKQQPNEHETRAACIAYVELFHNDRKNWKFNKARQNDLLRHLWDLESIPASLNDAVRAYMRGFTGTAASQRLADAIVLTMEPLLEDHEHTLVGLPTTTPEERRDLYDQVVERQRETYASAQSTETDEESLKVVRLETEKVERAGLLMRPTLWTLLRPSPAEDAPEQPVGKEEAPTPVVEAPPPDTKTEKTVTVSKRKSRKSRTTTYSSSESSSSDDETDSE